MLTFYGAYFTKALLLKKEGITANRLAKGEKSSYTKLLETAGIIITFSMPVVQCLSIYGLFPYLYIGEYSGIIGVGVAFIGVVFFIMALIAMKNSWRAGIDSSQKTALRTGGILQLSRNPAFIGFNLFYIGVALVAPNITLFILVAFALLLFHLQILEEEKFLSTTFGENYLQYKQKVRRYL